MLTSVNIVTSVPVKPNIAASVYFWRVEFCYYQISLLVEGAAAAWQWLAWNLCELLNRTPRGRWAQKVWKLRDTTVDLRESSNFQSRECSLEFESLFPLPA